MHLVILLLAALAVSVYLTLLARGDPDKRAMYLLFVVIDLWLGGVFAYLVVSALLDFN